VSTNYAFSSTLAGVTCFACNTSHDPRQLLTVCTACGLPLRVDYDLSRVTLKLSDLRDRPPTLWRYQEVLPVLPGAAVSLGEGFTPLLEVGRNVWVKDESRNPTGSIAVTDEEADAATHELASASGIDVCPEGGAACAALAQLREQGIVGSDDKVVVFNTGTGLKYR